MKILINTPELAKDGGVSSYCRALLEHLPPGVESFTIGARTSERGVRGRSRRFLSDYLRFRRLLLKQEFDLVHLNPSLAASALIRDGIFLSIAKKRGLKALVFIHGWDEAFEDRMRKRWLWIFRRVYSRADGFIVLAEDFRNRLVEMGCKKPIFCETTSVEETVFANPAAPPRKPGSNNGFNILYLSRIERDKGIFETLDAFAILKKKHAQLSLTVAGDGGALDDARRHAHQKQLQDVSFLGYVRGEDKDRAFRRADCYLFPTTHGEGLPISVLEAMASGLPVVTRPVGGLSDFFEDGKMGYILQSVDPLDFANAVETLIERPELCAEIGQYNREYARNRFSASRVAERIVNIYQHIAEPERP